MNENEFDEFMSMSVFMSLSILLTDFTEFRLYGTGMADTYFETLSNQIGGQFTQQYLLAYATIQKQSGNDEDELNKLFRKGMLSDEKYGPITRNIITMWFLGLWDRLPEEWYAKYGQRSVENTPFVISPLAYTEALLWPAIGSHPPAAKAPGYGTWSEKPVFEKSSLTEFNPML